MAGISRFQLHFRENPYMPDDDGATGEPGAPDAGSADDGSDAGDPGSLSIADFASTIDAEALADKGHAPASDTKGEDGEGSKSGKPGQPEDQLTAFINKNYGGDKEAFLEAQYTSREQSKHLATTVKELQDRLSKVEQGPKPTRDEAAVFKHFRDRDPEITDLDQQFKETVDLDKALHTRLVECAQDATKTNAAIQRIQGQLTHAPEEERTKLFADLMEARTNLGNYTNEYASIQQRIGVNVSLNKTLARDIRRSERELLHGLRSKQREEDNTDSANSRVLQDFDDAFTEHVGNFDVDIKTLKGKLLYQNVQALLAEFLESKGEQAHGLDSGGMNRHVAKLLPTVAKEMSIQKAKAKVGTPAPRALGIPRGGSSSVGAAAALRAASERGSAPGAPGGNGRADSSLTELLQDPKYVRERANRIQNEMQRRAGAGGRSPLFRRG